MLLFIFKREYKNVIKTILRTSEIKIKEIDPSPPAISRLPE